MVNTPPPFRGLNIRIPMHIPFKGRGGSLRQGSGLLSLPLGSSQNYRPLLVTTAPNI